MIATSTRRRASSFHPGAESLETRSLLTSNVVVAWNQVLLEAVRADNTPPPRAARNMAIVHAAVFDAVNSITEVYEPYHIDVRAPRGASLRAAVASAAHGTLTALYPARSSTFDAALTGTLAGVRDPLARRQGIAVGARVADAILALRADDGSDRTVTYDVPPAPGVWRPTPPAFAAPALPQWGQVEPFAITTADQYRPDGPPALSSVEYAAALAEVQALGSVDSTARTADQTEIALFWADGANTYTPPGHWNRIAQDAARRQALNIARTARLFARLNLALADAGIVAWAVKYDVNLWRPVTAIREADTDGNSATVADPDWTPLIATPPFPTYTSGHSTFSAAAAAVLTAEFGAGFRFTTESVGLPGVRRSFTSFAQAAREAGRSRVYGGIHFEFDNIDGLESGAAVGRHVASRYLGPRRSLA
jgi:membrane-associated phospholipid phosphatase